MSLVLAGAATLSLLVAVHALRRQRAAAADLGSLRRQVRELSERVATTEKSADDASSRAQAAGRVLLEKGLANEEDLEAARRGFDFVEDAQPARGTRTVH